MGQEIATSVFTEEDFRNFQEMLRRETGLLRELFENRAFSEDHGVGGFELEAWLVGEDHRPAPINEKYLKELGDPMVCAELANFNIELNNTPHRLGGGALELFREGLEETLDTCAAKARELGASVALIGILPTVSDGDLVPENMSRMKRYRALNDQVISQRHGHPVHIDIEGRERLDMEHGSVMLEAATTALQIQYQVSLERSVRFYNASLALAAPLVAVSANSPLFLGKDLWDETRVPVFEQSLAAEGPNRVTLGAAFAKDSLFEIFEENYKSYRTLLPMLFEDDPPARFCHLRLHNGTIWRWNRPLIGFSGDGAPHIRIEHRTPPSGPTVTDIIANIALYFGLVETLGNAAEAPETKITFEQVRDNFYRAAKDGLDATIKWLNGKDVSVKTLFQDELVPMALDGLLRMGMDKSQAEHYIGVIRRRAETGRNGAAWQREYRARRKCGMEELCAAYMERQNSGKPVSEWDV